MAEGTGFDGCYGVAGAVRRLHPDMSWMACRSGALNPLKVVFSVSPDPRRSDPATPWEKAMMRREVICISLVLLSICEGYMVAWSKVTYSCLPSGVFAAFQP